MPGTSLKVSLAVMFVSSGGNTCDGRYFYSFTPATINVSAPDTEIVFTLSQDTAARFQITDLYASDNGGNLSGLTRSSDRRSLSIVNANKIQQLVLISLLVMDGDMRINCDPQMTNTPTGSGA